MRNQPPHAATQAGTHADKHEQLSATSSHRASPVRGRWKVLISIAVVVHLLAVVAEPMRFFSRSSRGTSPMVDPIRWSLAPYVEFAYLNHGYFFFAPEPGPSHLIECRLKFGDEEGRLRFPDRKAQWPRLLYHRHFMLAEFLHQLHEVPVIEDLVIDNLAEDLATTDPQLLADWRADRQRYEMIRDSMARHLRERYGADEATLDRIEHRLPSSVEVLIDRLPLDDPRFYLTLPDAPFAPPDDPLVGNPVPPIGISGPPIGSPVPGIGIPGPAAVPARPPAAAAGGSAEVVAPTGGPTSSPTTGNPTPRIPKTSSDVGEAPATVGEQSDEPEQGDANDRDANNGDANNMERP